MLRTEQFDYARRRIPGVTGLPGAAFLNDRLNDVVLLLTALPEIVVHLRAIQEHVVHLDDDVALMRSAVEHLESEVQDLRGELNALGTGINEVCASVGRLEPHISDISRLARPLKRRRRSEERPLGLSAVPSPEDDAPVTGLA